MKLLSLVSAVLAFSSVMSTTITDVYDFKMSVKVPRVYNNMASLGYRKYQHQRIVGEMRVVYDTENPFAPTVVLTNLVNKTHKVSGVCVKYTCEPSSGVRWAYLGDNKTGIFKTPSVSFAAELYPDYNVQQTVDEDNSMFVSFAGLGSSSTSYSYRNCANTRTVRLLHGYVTGTIGCGCHDYGHLSPTRVIWAYWPLTDVVTDVASVYGTWTAKFRKSSSGVIGESHATVDE